MPLVTEADEGFAWYVHVLQTGSTLKQISKRRTVTSLRPKYEYRFRHDVFIASEMIFHHFRHNFFQNEHHFRHDVFIASEMIFHYFRHDFFQNEHHFRLDFFIFPFFV